MSQPRESSREFCEFREARERREFDACTAHGRGERKKDMTTLSPSYAGYLEAYSPHSPDTARIVAGAPGDVVEEISRWVDLDTHTTWLLVSLREREPREDREPIGWLLESETIKL